MADDKGSEWFTLDNALKVGLGLAVGAAGVKYAMDSGAIEGPKKASANTGEAPKRRKKGKRRAKASPDGDAAAKAGSAASNDYSRFVKARMPDYIARGIKSSDAMSRIAQEWRAKKGR